MIFVVEKIRELAETNSSSLHVYTYSNKDKTAKIKEELIKFLKESNYKLILHQNGWTEFGRDCDEFTHWEDIWNWLLIGVYNDIYAECAPQEFNSAMDYFIAKLEKFTGINKNTFTYYSRKEYSEIFIKNYEAFIDHQSSDIPLDILAEEENLGKILNGIIKTGSDEYPECFEEYVWV